ncbi:MAG: sigma-70 family RNA polymerase sigma factor [Armatimonadetes bacterium]|nr:sigma-70 family RNA polymerase sigma factor [Armatimonadota bacterium]
MTRTDSADIDPDQRLVELVLRGDMDAFDRLVERHHVFVYNIVHGVVGNADDAADVAQEVFLLVLRKLSSFRRGSRFATWLYRVAVNRALDRARTLSRRRWVPFAAETLNIVDPAMGPEAAATQQSDADRVQAAMAEIAPNHRDVLVLKYFQDMSIEEISEVLGCSHDAAKVRLHRARLRFRDKYRAMYGDADADF